MLRSAAPPATSDSPSQGGLPPRSSAPPSGPRPCAHAACLVFGVVTHTHTHTRTRACPASRWWWKTPECGEPSEKSRLCTSRRCNGAPGLAPKFCTHCRTHTHRLTQARPHTHTHKGTLMSPRPPGLTQEGDMVRETCQHGGGVELGQPQGRYK